MGTAFKQIYQFCVALSKRIACCLFVVFSRESDHKHRPEGAEMRSSCQASALQNKRALVFCQGIGALDIERSRSSSASRSCSKGGTLWLPWKWHPASVPLQNQEFYPGNDSRQPIYPLMHRRDPPLIACFIRSRKRVSMMHCGSKSGRNMLRVCVHPSKPIPTSRDIRSNESPSRKTRPPLPML